MGRLDRFSFVFRSWLFGVSDLLLVWTGLTVLHAILPRDSWLAAPSALPWAALTLCIALTLRGRSLLPPPHKALTARLISRAGYALRLSMALIPWAILLWLETGDALARELPAARLLLIFACALSAVVFLFIILGHFHALTAWEPHEPGYWQLLLTCLSAWVCSVLVLSLLRDHQILSDSRLNGLAFATLVGMSLALAGILSTPRRHIRQQLRMQRQRDAKTHSLFRRLLNLPAIALMLSVLGAILLEGLVEQLLPALGFGRGHLYGLFICLVVAAIFPRPVPRAVACILHEVQPRGTGESKDVSQAEDYVQVPHGALVFNPLDVKRTRRFHPLLVRVEDLRVPPALPTLWSEEAVPEPAWMLGPTSFEAIEGVAQWHTLTIRKGARELAAWRSDQEGILKRILVLRPFAPRWRPARNGRFEHEAVLQPEQLQSMGDASDRLTLRNGDFLLMSVEGVVRAWELEIGCPVYDDEIMLRERPPVLEDYVRLT